MFRQLLVQSEYENEQSLHNDLYFPNLNQLIKVQTACVQKNIGFVPFIKMNPKNHHIEHFLNFLDEFKNEKIKFITNLHYAEDDACYIEISQFPIHVQDSCNYFLLNAFWISQKIQYLGSLKSNNVTYATSDYKNKKKHNDPFLQSKEIFLNLCYMLSSTIYVPAENLTDLLLTIKQDHKKIFGNLNHLKVVSFLGVSSKKQDGRISSTAAETKAFHYDTIESEFQEDNNFYDKGKESRTNSASRKMALTEGSANFQQRSVECQRKYFSRISYIEVEEKNFLQKILQEVDQSNDSKSQSFLMLETVQNLFKRLSQKQKKLMSLSEFETMNISIVNDQIFSKILRNYQNSIEQEFGDIDEKSIDEIKTLLKQLFDKALIEFYEQFQYFSNPEMENLNKEKLLDAIYKTENILFQNINKGKKESFSRRLDFFEHQNHLDISTSEYQTKFNALLGERVSDEQEIGFNLYRETMKVKISKIFTDLTGDGQRKTTLKSRKGKLMSRNELSTNIDRRIDILEGQKRNLEQSLLYEQKLQQNLMEYYYGKQSMPNRKEIETISEYSEDRDSRL